ncbi:MAG: hypothetical protein IJF32_09105, partial [Oscillospiraceae bacterium]|nr:hypothetical protein [Oscillospiraceae bacterium]
SMRALIPGEAAPAETAAEEAPEDTEELVATSGEENDILPEETVAEAAEDAAEAPAEEAADAE